VEIEKTVENGVCTLKVIGSIDRFAKASLKNALIEAKQYQQIRLDLSNVDLVGSVLVNLLVELRNQSPAEAEKLIIVNPPEHAMELLRAFRLGKLFRITQAG